jgi:hypothetical protein
MSITFFCKLHNENYDLWLHKWRIAINLYPKHAWYIIYNLIFSRTIYLAPVARLVCQNVLGENTRRRYICTHSYFRCQKQTVSKSLSTRVQKRFRKMQDLFLLTRGHSSCYTTATCIINAVKKGSFGLSCGNVLGVRICCCIYNIIS